MSCKRVSNGGALFLVAAALILGPVDRAQAGVILLSGDSNTTDTLNAVGNEQTFFSNVLGGGNTVAVLDFIANVYGSASNTDTEVDTFFDSLAGVTSTLISGAVTDALLAGVDLFVVPLPDDNFAAAEVAAIADFLSGGGTLFLLGENNNVVFDIPNGAINQLLAALGSGMSLSDAALSGPGVLAVDPYTAGLNDLRFVAGSQVVGGTAIYSTQAGAGLIAREGRVTQVPEPATLLLFGAAAGVAGLRRRFSRS
jgi:hypothetical protein